MTTPVEWLAALVKWIVDTFKGDIIVVVKKQILRWWRKLFAGKNVLILGGKATGKTSLLMFLQNGRPYEIGPDGQKRYPNPTGVGAIIDKRVNVNDQGWIQLTKDIGGDPDLRPFWRRLIREIQPEGIIYMLDGSLTGDELNKAVSEIRDDVLVEFNDGPRQLRAFHVFLNFADRWSEGNMDGIVNTKIRSVEDLIGNLLPPILRESVRKNDLLVKVADTQLSPTKAQWIEAKRAVNSFAGDLNT